MKTNHLIATLLLIATPCFADDVIIDLDNLTAQAKTIAEKINSPTPKTPAETKSLQKEKETVIGQIAGIADKRPDNPAAQLAVGKSLASVEEAPRAIPYAERGLRLAEASGDKKMIREALLTGSEVFYKAGNYALARERAQRILKDNPKDKDALALYMQVKDRGAASAVPASSLRATAIRPKANSPPRQPPGTPGHPGSTSARPRFAAPPALKTASEGDPSLGRAFKHYSEHCASTDKYSCDAAQISSNCFDSSAKNICVRNCLVTDDEQCVKSDEAHRPGCRVKSHIRCYALCRKFIPNIVETSCYTKLWGSFLGNTK